MASYLKSENVRIFPCANRSQDIESKLITEYGLTHLVSLAGAENCVLATPDSDGKLKISIGGYYVEIIDEGNALTGMSELYFYLPLIEKALTSSSADSETTVIGKYEDGTIATSTDLDEADSSETYHFMGLFYDDGSSSTYNEDGNPLSGLKTDTGSFAVLHARRGGTWANVNPIGTGEIQDSAVTTDKIEDAAVVADKLGNVIRDVAYADLVKLRDGGKLQPGCQYRITDYVCTTTTDETQSAGNQFDVIVTADSESVLNENARACLHAGDTYFANSKLESWQIKYCLDNDASRFGWAYPLDSNEKQGTGVIYYMKDEFGNEAPYDFKNIQFKRYAVTANSANADLSSLSGLYVGIAGITLTGLTRGSDSIYCYTFHTLPASGITAPTVTDASLQAYAATQIEDIAANDLTLRNYNNAVSDNKISPYQVEYSTDESATAVRQQLNNIVLFASYDGEKLTGTSETRFGEDCHDISLLEKAHGSNFGINCYAIAAGSGFSACKFGAGCRNNVFGNECNSTVFGDVCYNNAFGDTCRRNSFLNYCLGNSFKKECSNNITGNNFRSNILGQGTSSNRFGIGCMYMTIGDGCVYNDFGHRCQRLNIVIAGGYARQIAIDPGCLYLTLTCTDEEGSDSNYLQNVHVHEGVCGTSTSYKTITIETRGNSFCTDVRTQTDQFVTV